MTEALTHLRVAEKKRENLEAAIDSAVAQVNAYLVDVSPLPGGHWDLRRFQYDYAVARAVAQRFHDAGWRVTYAENCFNISPGVPSEGGPYR